MGRNQTGGFSLNPAIKTRLCCRGRFGLTGDHIESLGAGSGP
jgi:hypothetical protein